MENVRVRLSLDDTILDKIRIKLKIIRIRIQIHTMIVN